MLTMQNDDEINAALLALQNALTKIDAVPCALAAGYVQLAIDRIEGAIAGLTNQSSPNARKLQ